MRWNGVILVGGLILAGCAISAPENSPARELTAVLEEHLPAPKAPLLLPVYRETAFWSTPESVDPDKETLFLRQPRRLREPAALAVGAETVPGAVTAPEKGSGVLDPVDVSAMVVPPELPDATPEWVAQTSRDFAFLLVVTPDGRIGRLTRRPALSQQQQQQCGEAGLAASEGSAERMFWTFEALPRRRISDLGVVLELCALKAGEKRPGTRIPDSEFRFLRAAYTPEETAAVLTFLRNIPPVQ